MDVDPVVPAQSPVRWIDMTRGDEEEGRERSTIGAWRSNQMTSPRVGCVILGRTASPASNGNALSVSLIPPSLKPSP